MQKSSNPNSTSSCRCQQCHCHPNQRCVCPADRALLATAHDNYGRVLRRHLAS